MRVPCAMALLAVLTVSSALKEASKIHTENGLVIGVLDKTHHGQVFFSYLGIPYAQPPIGDLRFEEPKRLTMRWTQIWKADAFPKGCMAYDNIAYTEVAVGKRSYNVTGSEDCLYLNVFTNQKNLHEGNKDVIVFIHGGGFQFGDTKTFQAHAIMDRPGIVYVSIQYRLGVLGFLSTGDVAAPGNIGLKDQVAALEWVQRNIANFGGNPKKITITGMSAGGASVHMMYMSPLAVGLFSKGISHSGSALCPWAMMNDLPAKTKRLAELLHCPTNESAAIVKCLKKKKAIDIVTATRSFKVFFYNPFSVFAPTVDSASPRPFLPKHPLELMKTGKFEKLPWMTTVTSGEGLYSAAEYLSKSQPQLLSYVDSHWGELAPSILFYNSTVPQQQHSQVAENLKKAFLNNEKLSPSTMVRYIRMLTDRNYVNPAIQSATLMTEHKEMKAPVYVSLMRYRGKFTTSDIFNKMSEQFGVGHADDALYLYDTPNLHMNTTKDDRAMGSVLLNIEAGFASHGVPPAGLKWRPFQHPNQDQYMYLEIRGPKQIKMKSDSEIGSTEKLDRIFGHVEKFDKSEKRKTIIRSSEFARRLQG